MAKGLVIKAECLNSNRSKTGASVVFSVPQPANQEPQKPGAQAPRNSTVVALQLPDSNAAANFEPGKTYTIKIDETA